MTPPFQATVRGVHFHVDQNYSKCSIDYGNKSDVQIYPQTIPKRLPTFSIILIDIIVCYVWVMVFQIEVDVLFVYKRFLLIIVDIFEFTSSIFTRGFWAWRDSWYFIGKKWTTRQCKSNYFFEHIYRCLWQIYLPGIFTLLKTNVGGYSIHFFKQQQHEVHVIQNENSVITCLQTRLVNK